jgi:cytoskeletal protein CcmA (bactofilin family)
MGDIGQGIVVRGDISMPGDLTIEGRVEGSVWCDGYAVTIAPTATLDGEVFARDITVFGVVSGTLVASEVVDLRADASVKGRILAARLILTDGAAFNGTAEPQHLQAALSVARHRHQAPVKAGPNRAHAASVPHAAHHA